MKSFKIATLTLTLTLLLGACASTYPEIEADWPPEYYFKAAQSAMDNNNYEKALYYLDVFIIRFPEEKSQIIAAEFEQAFMYYKMKDYDTSQILLEKLLDKYETSPWFREYSDSYRVLAEKILKQIEEM